jgi:hypothetical protein
MGPLAARALSGPSAAVSGEASASVTRPQAPRVGERRLILAGMKYLFLAALLAGAAPAQTLAQASPASSGAYRYCALVVSNDDYLTVANIMRLDYGRRDKKSPTEAVAVDAVLEEASKQISKARNTIFALNYLSDLGWECFNVTSIPAPHNGYAETRYLLRKPKAQ